MEIKNNSHPVRSVAFQGYQHKKTETGAEAFHLNCMYDSSKYDCELQCFRVGCDKKTQNFFVERGCNNSMEPFFTASVPKEGIIVEPGYDLELEDNEPFAYRMVLKDKRTGEVAGYLHEDNNEIDGCSIIHRNGTTVTKQGPMYLGIADTFAPGYVYAGFNDKNTGDVIEPDKKQKQEIAKKVRATNRTFGTVVGGTMAGLEAKIPELADAGCKRLITTPLQGGATASADKYWNENNYLTAGGLGNRNNIASLQRTAFKYGMNMVDDGTFTSESPQGVHFNRALKWMDNEDIPDEFYYFRMSGLKDGALGFGVVPENFENLNCKLVNFPFDIVRKKDGSYEMPKNNDYDATKPSHFQIFDNSMVSDKQRTDKKNLIVSYDKTTPDGNKLAISTHNDTAIPYHFDVNPYEIKKNIESLNEVNKMREDKDKIKVNSPQGAMFIGEMSGIAISPKVEGGFVCWNAYTDLAKYNYFTSNYDNELLSDIKNPVVKEQEMNKLRRANCQLRDMACGVARYRTANVRNNITEYTARTIGEISSNPAKAYSKISDLVISQNPKNPKLPEDILPTRELVKNVLEDNYEFRPHYENYDDAILSSMMDLPLDSIEFSPEVQGALSSPFLSKLSSDNDHVGQTRFEAMNDETYKVPQKYAKSFYKVNDTFKTEIKSFADRVLKEVDKNSKEKLFDEDGEMTEYGKYLIPFVGQDIARYAVTKALMPTAKAKIIKGGEIAYDYDDMTKRGTLAHMNINGDSQKDEANQIANRLKNGVMRLGNDNVKFVAESINKRFANTNTNSLKLAEAMIRESGYGLDWRFDAAKDVADMDSVRNGDQRMETAIRNNRIFWGDMDRIIKGENPNSYAVAEITDMNDDAVEKLLTLTGITTEANYSYFFDGISDMFGYSYVTGDDPVGNSDSGRVNKLENVFDRFSVKPLDYKRNSYTFASNHDKPRMVHCLSMDMSLFHADLNNLSDKKHRTTAYMIMNDIMKQDEIPNDGWNKIDNDSSYFKNVSPKAIANGELLRNSIGSVNYQLKTEELKNAKDDNERQKIEDKYNKIYAAMSKSVADVVNGKYYKNAGDVQANKSIPESFKKTGEKDGFGTKPIPDAFDIVYDQACEKHHLKGILNDKELLNYRNKVDSRATEVGRAKTRIIMRYLCALPGNPTLYAGDEFGMTGYEDRCQNTYLQNRLPLDWSIVDKDSENYREDIDEYRNSILDILRVRKRDDMNRMEALNNGSVYKLAKQEAYKNGTNEKIGCSAIMSHASNGAMNISVFNPNGISTDPKVPVSAIHPTDAWLDSIYLKGKKEKLSVTPGTEFKNVNPNDKAIYRVCNKGDDYYIKRIVNGKEDGILMDGNTAPDGVMMLYHIPKDIEESRLATIAKKTEARRQYYNPVHNIPKTNGYDAAGKSEAKNGSKFDVTSNG